MRSCRQNAPTMAPAPVLRNIVCVVGVISCAFLISSCMPAFLSSKRDPAPKNPPAKTTQLIKPKLSDDLHRNNPGTTADPEGSGASGAQGTPTHKQDGPNPPSNSEPEFTRDEPRQSEIATRGEAATPVPESQQTDRSARQTRARDERPVEGGDNDRAQEASRPKEKESWLSDVFGDKGQSKDSSGGGSKSSPRTVRVDSTPRKKEKGQDEYMDSRLSVPPRTKNGDDDPLAQKEYERHDHRGYVQRLKESAMTEIAKSKDCDLAMLCQDNITEEWWLLIYTKKGKRFYSSSYAWDSISETWDQSAHTGNRPISEWDAHMRYLDSSKKCRTLKGAK